MAKQVRWYILVLLVVLTPLLGAWTPEEAFNPGLRTRSPLQRSAPARALTQLMNKQPHLPVSKSTPIQTDSFPIIGANPAPIYDCTPCGVCTNGGLGFEPEHYWYIRRASKGETEDGYVLEVKCVCPAYRKDTGGKPPCFITIHRNGNIFINRGRGNYGPLPGYIPTGSVPTWPG